MNTSIEESFQEAKSEINLACVLDHSGRGGNAFFLTIFDQHAEVLSCPVLHYTYSYLLTEFGSITEIDSVRAKEFLVQKSYFRLLYNDLDDENRDLFFRMGGDPDTPLKREKIRYFFDTIMNSRTSFARKDLVLLVFLSYAYATKRDFRRIRFILTSDAISLRKESGNLFSPFSGKVVDEMIQDFPQAKLFHIERDPRATFASPKHQYVNWLGNMYHVKPGNFIERMFQLLKKDITQDAPCVYLFWLMYLAESLRAISRKMKQYPEHFHEVKNEDLNLHFRKTMRSVCAWLEVPYDLIWDAEPYIPTFTGRPWQGTGAYNNRYQNITNGLLGNDPENIAKISVGPNAHVTSRWKTRLKKNEIVILEKLFREELENYSYEFLYVTETGNTNHSLITNLLKPFGGEIPTTSWIIHGFGESSQSGVSRIYYCFCLVPLYILSRLVLIDIIYRKRFFHDLL
jgi:hypothetical protein